MKPNIIIFNPDEMRADALSHLGQPGTATPVLDELVSTEALSFSSAFCQNPVCTPSRCSFMTGLYPHDAGHRTMEHMLDPRHGEKSMLRVLRENGYTVWWGGKNDLIPGECGWQNDADIRYVPTEEDLRRLGVTEVTDLHRDDEWRGEPGGDNWYTFMRGEIKSSFPEYCDSDWLNVYGAVDFIRSYDGEKPFCIFLPLSYPHPPYGVESEFLRMIDEEKLFPRRPDNTDPAKPPILKALKEGQRMQGWSEEEWRHLRAVYYGMCARTDRQAGMVIDAMKEKGLWDESLFMFFSDHGDWTGDYGLVEKNQNTFEDPLVRVPLIVKAPRSEGGRHGVTDALAELTDITATVYDLTGIDPGYWSFGRSLLPIIRGESNSHRDAVFSEGGRLRGERSADEHSVLSEYPDPSYGLYYPRMKAQSAEDPILHGKAAMIRTGRWKYVLRLYEKDELYDLMEDPMELRNAIDDPACREVLAELRLKLLLWYQETADTVPYSPNRRNFI